MNTNTWTYEDSELVYIFLNILKYFINILNSCKNKSKSVYIQFMLLLFSCQIVSDSLWTHGLQHARLPCHSPFPGVCSSSCPLNQWCHPTILSSLALFSFYKYIVEVYFVKSFALIFINNGLVYNIY